MILSELFNNALDHGILKLDSSLKQHEEGMEKYFDERAKTLGQCGGRTYSTASKEAVE